MRPKNGTDDEIEDKNDLGAMEPGGNVKIDLTEPEEDEDDEDKTPLDRAARGEEGGERVRDPKTGKWAAKKAERAGDHRAKKAWEQERSEYDRRLQRMQEDFTRQQQESDRRFEQMRQEMARATSGGGGRPADPFAAKLQEVQAQINAELKLIEASDGHGYDRYHQLQEQKAEIVAQRTFAKMQAEQQQNQRPTQQDPYAHRLPFIEAEFPWINDPRFRDLANKASVIRQTLIALDGRPDTLDTDREALTTAIARFGAEFGLRPPARPSQRTRAFYASPGSNEGPRRGGGEEHEIEVPRQLLNGTRLNENSLRAALRSRGDD